MKSFSKVATFSVLSTIFALAFLAACSSRDEALAYPIPSGMQLVWFDEFDYEGAPNPEKWGYSLGANGWGNNELQSYTDSRANSWVRDGKLFIKAENERGEWTSARLNTLKTESWTHGYFEMRAKLAQGAGIHSAFWLLPTDDLYGRWPRSGEIDIAEYLGAEVGTIYHAAHTAASSEEGGKQSAVSRVRDAVNKFHNYAVEWAPGFIRWTVDGRETLFLENDGAGSESWPFDIPFYIILSVAVDAIYTDAEGADNSIKDAVMEVDHVRVYQRIEEEN